MSSDWSDTTIWFGQIHIAVLNYYHPIHMILGYNSEDESERPNSWTHHTTVQVARMC